MLAIAYNECNLFLQFLQCKGTDFLFHKSFKKIRLSLNADLKNITFLLNLIMNSPQLGFSL